MSSKALQRWRTVAADELDEIESAHAAVGGSGRGHRAATQQINHAYVVLLASQFQRFCRDLNTEAVHRISQAIRNPEVRRLFDLQLTARRQLDTRNAQPGSIGADFGRLGLFIWRSASMIDRRTAGRRTALEQLNSWRNAIVHQDFDPAKLAPSRVDLAQVREWRRKRNGLAETLDRAVEYHVQAAANEADGEEP